MSFVSQGLGEEERRRGLGKERAAHYYFANTTDEGGCDNKHTGLEDLLAAPDDGAVMAVLKGGGGLDGEAAAQHRLLQGEG